MWESNYTKQMKASREDFLRYDQEKMIRRFGLEADENFLYVEFFGRRYCVSRKTGEASLADGGGAAGFSETMSVYDMLCYSKEDARLSGEWRTIGALAPHSGFGSSGSDFFSRTAAKFSGKTDALKLACLRIGGRAATAADAGFLFDAFPSFPIIFQFWDGDDEFAPRVNFLFDKNALDYIHFETAWYIAGFLAERLEEMI